MRRLYGLDMQLPEGKLPGFYAQIVKGIAERVSLFDRYKELLILENPADIPSVLELLTHYNVAAEPVDLLAAPESAVTGTGRFEDFAFVTRDGNAYFDLASASVFRLTEGGPEAEPAPALMQLEEHLIARIAEEGALWHVIERQLSELADRIAGAYRCGIQWLDADSL